MDFTQLARMTRINVVGTSGSGKSTFGRRLAEVLELPFHEMDSLFWKPDWQESADDEFFPKVRDVTAAECWVLDGNYTRTIPIKWQRVEAVVWLDLSYPRTVARVTKRAVGRIFSQNELWPGTGNRESFAKTFLSTDSVIRWAMTTYQGNRKKCVECMADPQYAHVRFFRLSSPSMVAKCLAAVARERSAR